MRFLKTFMKKGTVLFVSHDTRAVMNLCNKAILINHGHLENTGAPKEVAEHYLSTLYASDKNADKQDKLSNNTPSNIHHEEFGTGNARIISAEILGQDNKPLNYLEGGEDIALTVHCIANKNISNPIIGFQFKDRLGQVVFADNTTIACQLSNYHFIKGSEFSATFEFQIPLLQSGHYSVTTAIAEELNESLIQHHWIHDALTIKVNSNGPCYGLIGVSMKQITLSKL
jgi:lipopolysaccharide transport system ATP-binding protein